MFSFHPSNSANNVIKPKTTILPLKRSGVCSPAKERSSSFLYRTKNDSTIAANMEVQQTIISKVKHNKHSLTRTLHIANDQYSFAHNSAASPHQKMQASKLTLNEHSKYLDNIINTPKRDIYPLHAPNSE